MNRHLKEGEPGERHRLTSKGGIFQLCCVRNQYPVLVLPALFECPFCLDYSLLLQEAFGAVTYSFCFLEIDLERKLYSNKVEDVLDPNASKFLLPSPGTAGASVP